MQDLGSRVITFFAAYFVFVALLFPVVLVARVFHVSERAERRMLNAIAWLAFLIPLGGLVVLTIAYYLAPNG